MEKLSFFFGRLHPLLVHLPIGILFLAFLFELLSRSSRYKKLDVAVQPAILWGAFMATASAISGYLLSQEGGYEDRLLTLHQNFGIATALFSILLYFIRINSVLKFPNRKKRKLVRIFLFLPLMILLIATGHFGGSLTHGEEFLTEFSSAGTSNEFADPAIKIKAIANLSEARLYSDIIQPVLESNCYSCHSSKKQKGQLRLDGIELISKGGKHGAVIVVGNADSSSLFSRLMLPLEDEHHMPPNEKPQLSSTTIDLIRLWINEGASFDKPVKSFNEAKKIIQSVQLLVENQHEEQWIPVEAVTPANEKAIKALQASGSLVLPIGMDNNYLSVSFMNSKAITPKELEQLFLIKDQLISLRFSFSTITNKDLTLLSKLDQLRWLYLDHTSITDDGAAEIAKLEKLQYLNLVSTAVTDQSLTLFTSLKDLKKIYLYETKVTSKGIENLLKHLPEVKIDSGNYSLPSLPSDTVIHKRKV